MAEISKITLPSGTTYDLKDAVAREMISAGITFIVAWNGRSTPTVANIPAGVTVTYMGTTYTGTLAADDAQPGAFYLVAVPGTIAGTDNYYEYVPVGEAGSKTWEMVGTSIVDLSGLVEDVTLNKQTTNFVTGYASPTTANVIGASSTFNVTQPTISVTPSTSYIKATASGGGAAWNNKDQKTVLTGLGTASTKSAIGASSTFTVTQPTVTVVAGTGSSASASVVTGITPTTTDTYVKSIYGVQSSTTTASKATAATSQTTATGAGTATSTNTDWLKGISVANETLTIGAATMDTQTTTQFTFSNVTVPIKNTSQTAFLTDTASGTVLAGPTIVTGITATSGDLSATASGADVAWNSKDAVTAVTGYASPTTATVIGSSSTFTNTQPTVALATDTASGTGKVQVATGISSATATDGAVAWNSKDQKTALTGLGTASTAAGLNNSTSITVDYVD